MTATPYTKAYTDNLIAALERTRNEVKDAIADLMTKADLNTTPTARTLAGRLHRTVGSITDDLDPGQPPARRCPDCGMTMAWHRATRMYRPIAADPCTADNGLHSI